MPCLLPFFFFFLPTENLLRSPLTPSLHKSLLDVNYVSGPTHTVVTDTDMAPSLHAL